jgi:S-adenosylmethionine hydrolase
VAPRPIITLTTDFGLADPYVASMKGVILTLNPDAAVIDVSHAVRPQQLRQGAFLLQTVLPFLPPGAVHVAVVDPGVGTARRAIALETAAGRFLGPDNGVLSPALPDEARAAAPEGGGPVSLPGGIRAVALTNELYQRPPVSDTFHGRDVFAPAAAHLSLGVPFDALGDPLTEVAALPPFQARKLPDGSLQGRVVHVDVFGNVITDVRGGDLPPSSISVVLRGVEVEGVARTYASAVGFVALVNSAGFLEVALPGGNAARELNVDLGAPVSVRVRA